MQPLRCEKMVLANDQRSVVLLQAALCLHPNL